MERKCARVFIMTENKSLMDDLYTDNGGFDKERVALVLKAILTIQRGEHSIFPNPGISLGAEDKILAYILVKKLLKGEGVVEDSGVSGKEVAQKTNTPQGTVDPAIQKLKKKDRLLAGSGKNYEIPAQQVETVLKRLEKYITKDK